MMDTTQRLVSAIDTWAEILDVAVETVCDTPQRIFGVFPKKKGVQIFGEDSELQKKLRVPKFGGMIGAHMVTIALRQIDQHARQLRRDRKIWRGELARQGDAFLMHMDSNELRDLRDVLEHAADYLVGDGHKPELVLDPDNNNGFPGVRSKGRELRSLVAFGHEYEVRDAIQAAIAFNKALKVPGDSRGSR